MIQQFPPFSNHEVLSTDMEHAIKGNNSSNNIAVAAATKLVVLPTNVQMTDCHREGQDFTYMLYHWPRNPGESASVEVDLVDACRMLDGAVTVRRRPVSAPWRRAANIIVQQVGVKPVQINKFSCTKNARSIT